ncbi:MAG: ATP-binding cassette subfamily B protein [Polaribacter sp.]
MDEVTSSLDSASENYIQKAIERLRRENKTIIIIEHSLVL